MTRIKGHRRVCAGLVSVVACLLLLPATAVPATAGSPAATPSSAGNDGEEVQPPAIRLRAATFVPQLGQSPEIPPGLSAESVKRPSDYHIVQLDGPVRSEWIDALEAEGAEVLAYVPDYALKVRMTRAETDAVAALDEVAWVGPFHPAYKLSSDVASPPTDLYRVRIEQGADVAGTLTAVTKSGASVIRAEGNQALVVATRGQVEAIARVDDTAWIEPFTFHDRHNELGGGVIMGAAVADAAGYDGSTQTVAVADTGLGDGTASGGHSTISAGRITGIFDWSAPSAGGCYNVHPDGPQDVDSGHGTHTSVSAVGAGTASGAGRGTAPAANLVFQAVEEYLDIQGLCSVGNPDGYYLIGLPLDLHSLYQQAYDAGARVHSNSWGTDVAGEYTVDSADTDDFVWDNPDLLVTFSAGNEGVDSNADGVVDNDSTGSPATAKNVLAVGASENDRAGDYACDEALTYTSSDTYQAGLTCTTMSGQNVLGTAGPRWGFTAEPLASDVTAGNSQQMAPFSSRGPTDDGRIKPDVVAPGTWVLSGFSSRYRQGYGGTVNPENGLYQWDGWGMPRSGDLKYMGGTSMSNPLAAGGTAVVRDFYEKQHSHAASAALVKATLINSAVDLADENNDGADDNDFPIPNSHEGWGRIDLAAATDGSRTFVDDAAGLTTAQSSTYEVQVPPLSGPLKVSLAWSDYPSTEGAATNLVNDLDLEVTAPDDTTYLGNAFSGGWSQSGGSSDDVNNVENVYVESPPAGTWTVTVAGTNVPMGPQPFALVTNAAELPLIVPGGAVVSEAPGGSVLQIPVSMSPSSAVPVTVDWHTLDTGGPVPGSDYLSDGGTLTFLPGETDKTVSIQVLDDCEDEAGDALGAEWLGVAFSNATNATIDTSFFGLGLGLIFDNDDPAPVIVPGHVLATEGDSGTKIVNAPVSLSAPAGAGCPVTADWHTFDAPGEPVDGEDYVSAGGQVTFEPGESEATVPFEIIGDTEFEAGNALGAEWAAVQYSNPTNATIDTSFFGLGLILITNDD